MKSKAKKAGAVTKPKPAGSKPAGSKPAGSKSADNKPDFARYEFHLLEVCSAIHCAASGSGDYLTNMDRLVEWLQWRITDGWIAGHEKHIEFDVAVKQLARATLLEEKTAWWHTNVFDRVESCAEKERKRIASFLRTLRLNARANAKTLADMIERGDHEQPNP